MSVAGYVIAVAATAPDLSELKPADKGSNSVIFAADGSRLGLRAVRRDPHARRLARHAGGPARGRDRDRGRALLQAQGRRLLRDRARGREEHPLRQERAGRLDDHPAARPRALHQGPRAQLHAQDPRGQAGLRARGQALEAVDPQELPQRRAVRHRRRPHRHRRRGRGRDLLQQAREGPRPARVRDARRPAPGALAVQPVPQPHRRHHAPQRGAREDGREPLHHHRRGRGGRRQAARPQARHALHPPPRALLLRLRAGEADRGVRRRRLPPRRA